MEVILHENSTVRQRASDGYICATELCKAAGKLWGNYWRADLAQEFVKCLAESLLLPVEVLVEINKGNFSDGRQQGTWVHPRVATHLAQWLSPEFAVKVSDWVLRFMTGDRTLHQDIEDRANQLNNTKSTVTVEVAPLSVDLELVHKREEVALMREQAEALQALNTAKMEAQRLLEHQVQFIAKFEKTDIHLYVSLKDDLLAQLGGGSNRKRLCMQEEDSAMHNKDLTQLLKDAGVKRQLDQKEIMKLGQELAKLYREKHPESPQPPKTKKHVNGAIRDVNVYLPSEQNWVLDYIKKHVV